jgi:hypothetical protein
MKTQFLKIAGVNSEKEFYEKYPTEASFFAAYPEANMMKDGGNVPTNPELWSRAKAAAKQKYDVYPSAYANGFAAKWYKERGGGWRKAEMGGCMECGGQMSQGGPIAEYSVNPMEMFYQEGGENDQMYQSGQEQPDLNAAIGEISKMIMQGDDPNEIYGMLIENGVEEDYALDILEEAMEGLEETDMEEEDVPMNNDEMQEFEDQEDQMMQEQIAEDDEELYSIDSAEKMRKGGSIKINPAKKGTFKAQATRMGMSVQEAADYILRHKEKYSPAMVKKANFAKNFARELGGEIYDLTQYKDGGGIPQRYRTMGFTRVGAKRKSTRPGKKWMVLAKKGDQYKVVHGGWKGMKDFTQHRNPKRKERFWDRMGGRDSSKAKDPFSPLYWHKRFGTWAEGGAITANYENTLANLAPNALNKSLMTANTLADPRNMMWALPNRGFLGTLKGIAGAAAGLSGAGLGYSKLLGTNNNPYSNTVKYQAGGQKAKTFQEWAAENPVFRRNDIAGYQNYLNSFIGSLNMSTPEGQSPRTSSVTPMTPLSVSEVSRPATPALQPIPPQVAPRNMFNQLQRTPSIVANPLANVPVTPQLSKMPVRQVVQVPVPEPQIKTANPYLQTPQNLQMPQVLQTTYGDPFGQLAANNAIAGLGMLNDVLSERDYAKEYEEMLRRTGNTDNRYNASNAVNPFGNYTLNAGPGSNFALIANTPIQDFGTSMASAKYGGTKFYEEGGEYYLSEDEIEAILANGGQIEYIN